MTDADLRNASLTYADLRGAKLSDCRLDGADLFRANFGGDLPANLHGVILSHATRLNEAILASRKGVAPRLFDVQWNDASLSGVDWSAVKKVADEKREYHKASRRSGDTWSVHNRRRIIWYWEAAQTYRQLSIALRSQGMNYQARRFTYRAEVARFWSLLHSLTQPKQWAPFVFSLLLGSISGWGYRLYRSAILYVTTILIFADLYRATSRYQYNGREAVVLSIIAFHGRAFSPNDNYGLGTTFSAVAAAEAFVGLFIEAIVIATFNKKTFLGLECRLISCLAVPWQVPAKMRNVKYGNQRNVVIIESANALSCRGQGRAPRVRPNLGHACDQSAAVVSAGCGRC